MCAVWKSSIIRRRRARLHLAREHRQHDPDPNSQFGNLELCEETHTTDELWGVLTDVYNEQERKR